jgi:hypothetical protein
MIGMDVVVPVLLGFVLRKKRQKVLVCLVQSVFLQITSSSRFRIRWVLPQRSSVHRGSKDRPWCLIYWCRFRGRKQQCLEASHFVTTLIPNEYRQSSKSSVLVFKFEVLRRFRMPIARYCLSVELVRVRSSIDS